MASIGTVVETLKPGDSVSAVIVPQYDNTDGTGSFVGLCLATATSVQNPYRIMGVHLTASGGWLADVEGASLGAGSTADLGGNMSNWNTQSLLTLARGAGANENAITWTFSEISGTGMSGTGTFTIPGLASSTGLYFGTAAVSPNTTAQPAWGDLTYTTVPEPGVLVLLATGLIGLLAYAWRKRR